MNHNFLSIWTSTYYKQTYFSQILYFAFCSFQPTSRCSNLLDVIRLVLKSKFYIFALFFALEKKLVDNSMYLERSCIYKVWRNSVVWFHRSCDDKNRTDRWTDWLTEIQTNGLMDERVKLLYLTQLFHIQNFFCPYKLCTLGTKRFKKKCCTISIILLFY